MINAKIASEILKELEMYICFINDLDHDLDFFRIYLIFVALLEIIRLIQNTNNLVTVCTRKQR